MKKSERNFVLSISNMLDLTARDDLHNKRSWLYKWKRSCGMNWRSGKLVLFLLVNNNWSGLHLSVEDSEDGRKLVVVVAVEVYMESMNEHTLCLLR